MAPRSSLEVVSRIAGIATSAASARQRTDEMLDELSVVFPFDAGVVCALSPGATTSDPLIARSYPAHFVDYLASPEWYAEAIEPFGIPRTGWPVCERDLPVDPMSLRGVAEYGRPAGLLEGLLSALLNSEGEHVGFLMLSWSSAKPPPDRAFAVIGHVSTMLANTVDPLRPARALAAAMDDDSSAVSIGPDGRVLALRGYLADQVAGDPETARRIAQDLLGEGQQSDALVMPGPDGRWLSYRAARYRDHLLILTVREAEDLHGLTQRELEVLSALSEGRSNAEIAARLSVSTRTVRAHVEHIFAKLGVRTRSAAVKLSVAEGLRLASARTG
ncbi:MAG: hypothetical protein JWN87_547 [Frankiales bacterium]|jgi:DNA-binding NarL/FixJ family response regulator|nr:hypothetical protein [Frankiales bacterium]MCW2587460.1 hypothetical protein [Frankiales bacterium]